jgi:DNA-binding SARP family transcriptional activator
MSRPEPPADGLYLVGYDGGARHGPGAEPGPRTERGHFPQGGRDAGPAVVDDVPPECRVEVRCLGPFRARVGGAAVEGWNRGKVRSLFQLLVTQHDRPVSRDALVAALWPGYDVEAPAVSLKVVAHALRRALAAAGATGLTVSAHQGGYRLDTRAMWLDVDAFESSLALARRLDARGDGASARRLEAQAVDLYRGAFLEDSEDEWVGVRREVLADGYHLALSRLAGAALAAGDHESCIARCQQLLAVDPCREDAYRTLMICHARLGQRGRVHAWYRLCVRVLRNELEVAPEPETHAVYRRAVSGALVPAEFSPAGGRALEQASAATPGDVTARLPA